MRGIAIQSDGRVSLGSNPPDGSHFVTQTSTEYQHQQNADKNRKGRNTLKFNRTGGGMQLLFIPKACIDYKRSRA